METEQKVYEYLDALQIEYQKHKHPAVFTVGEALKYHDEMPGGQAKNLFLRNAKGNRHFLVVLEHDKQLDIKALQQKIDASKLSFASPRRLETYLGLTPGSVSPFGLVNDSENAVETYIDMDLLRYEHVNFHPNVNTATLTLRSEDFKRFLEHIGNRVHYLEF